MLIELRCATHGGAREEVVPGNLNSEPSGVNSISPSQYSVRGWAGFHVCSSPNEPGFCGPR